jgi:hypothetical protein
VTLPVNVTYTCAACSEALLSACSPECPLGVGPICSLPLPSPTCASGSGGLLEWDMWPRIDRKRLPLPHKYASIGPQIRLSRVAIGPPPRHQQTTARAYCTDIGLPGKSSLLAQALCKKTLPALTVSTGPITLTRAVGVK